MAPMMGWRTRPVTGPARFSSGSSSALAPSIEYSGVMAVCCMPKEYWMPKKPRFISRIWRIVMIDL